MTNLSAYSATATPVLDRGFILTAPVGTTAPSQTEIAKWLTDTTKSVGAFNGSGYTSADNPPEFDTETEGGDILAVFEDPQFKQSSITQVDKINVNYVQWTEAPLKMWRGAETTFDAGSGRMVMPDSYTGIEQAALFIFKGTGEEFIALNFPRTVSAPNGSPTFEIGKLMELPITLTVLSAPGKPKGEVVMSAGIAKALGTGAAGTHGDS